MWENVTWLKKKPDVHFPSTPRWVNGSIIEGSAYFPKWVEKMGGFEANIYQTLHSLLKWAIRGIDVHRLQQICGVCSKGFHWQIKWAEQSFLDAAERRTLPKEMWWRRTRPRSARGDWGVTLKGAVRLSSWFDFRQINNRNNQKSQHANRGPTTTLSRQSKTAGVWGFIRTLWGRRD